MSTAEKKAEGLRKATEVMAHKLDKEHLRPMQKDAYQCMAKCCDTAPTSTELQKCVGNCERKVAIAQQVCNVTMQDFQGRLQRCMQRCQDQVQDSLPSSPSEKDIAKAQDKLANCFADCAEEYTRQIPRLERDITDRLKTIK
ncbi:hypothetical protein N2152v2_006108 [Parachlorella kessleri]